MAGVLTWIRQWRAGNGAPRPGTRVPDPASPPAGQPQPGTTGQPAPRADEAGGRAQASDPGAAEPEPPSADPEPTDPPAPIVPTAVITAGAAAGGAPAGPRRGIDIPTPREVLPDRPPTPGDLVMFLQTAVLGSNAALLRFLCALLGLGLVFLLVYGGSLLVAVVIQALVHSFAPHATPSLGTLERSGWILGGTGTAVFGGLRIRRWFRNRPQDPVSRPAGTTPSAAESDESRP
ncbi:hypothetical protein [Streptomyces monashensis]|uniref:Uncharacterized protein n=1 Tax=Streptomyces monashensis TaxID=1678012 RepID=A0A1S2QCJ7_9ACTN|nr:hypothetical protein [Streptomyces monashensis]OIK03423.1 hypothetical protein BIV23_21220 [Streptomyces monashensis]